MLIITASSGNNLELARLIESEAIAQGVTCNILDLCNLNLPLFHPGVKEKGAGDGLVELQTALHSHKSIFICAPEYNGLTPPVLSNAIAWLSVACSDFRELFNQRPVALGSHSGGGGGRVLIAMRQQFSYLGCTVLGRELLATFQKPAKPETIQALVQDLIKLESITS